MAFYNENPKCLNQREANPTVPVVASVKTFLPAVGKISKEARSGIKFGSVFNGDKQAQAQLQTHNDALEAWFKDLTSTATEGDVHGAFLRSLGARKVTGREKVQLTNATGTYVTRDVALSENLAARAVLDTQARHALRPAASIATLMHSGSPPSSPPSFSSS